MSYKWLIIDDMVADQALDTEELRKQVSAYAEIIRAKTLETTKEYSQMPKMGVDPELLKAAKPAPGNAWYKLKFKGFKPKLSKAKDSTNFNAAFEIVENTPENNGKPVYMGLNTKFAKQFTEFSHGLGYPLNPDGTFVGDWSFDANDPENIEKAQYKGPLLGRVAEAELVVTSYQGNEKNEVKQFRCKIDGCAVKYPDIKHITNMIKST